MLKKDNKKWKLNISSAYCKNSLTDIKKNLVCAEKTKLQ